MIQDVGACFDCLNVSPLSFYLPIPFLFFFFFPLSLRPSAIIILSFIIFSSKTSFEDYSTEIAFWLLNLSVSLLYISILLISSYTQSEIFPLFPSLKKYPTPKKKKKKKTTNKQTKKATKNKTKKKQIRKHNTNKKDKHQRKNKETHKKEFYIVF